LALSEAQGLLDNKNISIAEKSQAVVDAKSAVDKAKEDYDNKLIAVVPIETEPTVPGLRADIYTFDPQNMYPERSTTAHTFCKTITVDNIDKDWGGGNVEGCGDEFVMIHYTGFITVPTTDNYEFLAQADDGWYMTIGNTVVNDNWVLKGCGGWWSQPIALEGGKSYPIDAWFYEYGGGACNQLLYINSQTWSTVPAEWFSQNEQAPITYIKDPALLVLLEQAQQVHDNAILEYEQAQLELANANNDLRVLQDKQIENQGKIESALNGVTTEQEALRVAQQELQAIPPFREPAPTPEKTEEPVEEPEEVKPEPIPEPEPPTTPEVSEPELPVNVETVDPATLSNEQVAELISVANEILNNSEQGSAEYEEALEALFVAAEANDIELSEELAAIPGLSAAVDAINFIGNVGADMSPKVREESEKIVVTAIVAVGAAVNAATGAAMMAAPASASSNIIRRNT
jgi:outer membrane biosynthesis protein TonB